MRALGKYAVAALVFSFTIPNNALATDILASQEKAIAKKNTDDSVKSEEPRKSASTRAEVKSEAARTKMGDGVGAGRGSTGTERHRDPCTKQPEMSECKLTAPKK